MYTGLVILLVGLVAAWYLYRRFYKTSAKALEVKVETEVAGATSDLNKIVGGK